MNTSEKLKRAIDDRGIKYSFIAKKTGININSLSRSLIGKRRLQADELLSICQAIGIDLKDIQETA